MGNKVVTFTDEQLDDYQVLMVFDVLLHMDISWIIRFWILQDCTFFTRKEILRVFKRFREIKPDQIPKRMVNGEATKIKVMKEYIEALPELRENPFKSRICQAFSRDGEGNLTFEDFLDMFSVFSEQAPRDIKVFYAFKIYDFDNDGFISTEDLKASLICLTRNELTCEEHQQIAEKV